MYEWILIIWIIGSSSGYAVIDHIDGLPSQRECMKVEKDLEAGFQGNLKTFCVPVKRNGR